MDLSSLTPDKQVKLQYWLDVIRQCRASGLTNQIWCEQHDISLKSYYYWLSKIRKLALEELPRKKNGIHMWTDQQLTVGLSTCGCRFSCGAVLPGQAFEFWKASNNNFSKRYRVVHTRSDLSVRRPCIAVLHPASIEVSPVCLESKKKDP